VAAGLIPPAVPPAVVGASLEYRGETTPRDTPQGKAWTSVTDDEEHTHDDTPSEEAFLGDESPSEGHLLSFYDRLRQRMLAAVERRGGRLAPTAVRALLLVPDVFMLLVRLALDKEVPGSARAMIGGALAYFILPVDLLPEALAGAGGFVDDLVLAAAVLTHTFSGELEPYARKHWSGAEDLRKVLTDVSEAAEGLLGANLYERLRKLLAKRGIGVEEGA